MDPNQLIFTFHIVIFMSFTKVNSLLCISKFLLYISILFYFFIYDCTFYYFDRLLSKNVEFLFLFSHCSSQVIPYCVRVVKENTVS